jgi:hypothetical protein
MRRMTSKGARSCPFIHQTRFSPLNIARLSLSSGTYLMSLWLGRCSLKTMLEFSQNSFVVQAGRIALSVPNTSLDSSRHAFDAAGPLTPAPIFMTFSSRASSADMSFQLP